MHAREAYQQQERNKTPCNSCNDLPLTRCSSQAQDSSDGDCYKKLAVTPT